MKTRIITKIADNKYKLTCRSIYDDIHKKARVRFIDKEKFNIKNFRLIKY